MAPIFALGLGASAWTPNGAREKGSFSFAVTGDFNLHPDVVTGASFASSPESVWGDLIDDFRAFDALLLNHESTISGIFPDLNPSGYRYEDPINYTRALTAANAQTWVGQANNHQFDFWQPGVRATLAALRSHNITYGGLGSPDQVRKPTLLSMPNGRRLAVFALVAQHCHRLENGSAVMTSCTCGLPGRMSGMPPKQCYQANSSSDGLWFLDYPVGPDAIADTSSVVREYRKNNPLDFIIVYAHAGPNFEWAPNAHREWLLRNVSEAGADFVWGTSSHHIQRMELWKGRPVAYGLGDVLFRLIPGVTFLEACEVGMTPCAQFRPDLSIVYEFVLDATADHSPPTIASIRGHATRHDANQAHRASAADTLWLRDVFNELSNPYGLNATVSGSKGSSNVLLINPV